MKRLGVGKSTFLATMSSAEAVGLRAAGVSLTCSNKVTKVLVIVLNVQVGLVTDVGVGHWYWPLGVTVSSTGLSWVEGGYFSVSVLNNFLPECL